MNLNPGLRFRLLNLMLVLAQMGAAGLAFGQSQASTGQIVGTVTDQSGGVIPGATVTIVNTETGLKRELLTNNFGQYRAVSLPPGKYNVSIQATGFAGATQENLDVHVGTSYDVNFALKVGGVSEVIEVSGAGLESTRSEKGTIVDLTSIEKLPINGRRFHDFIQATPTVLVEPQRNQLSFAGQRGIYGNINIDGADYNQPFFGGIRGGERGNTAFTIPQESIAEFQVTAQGYSAEFGRSTGGIVNAVTRSGTNSVHGSGFYFLRHKAFGLTHGDCPPGGNSNLHGTNAFCQGAITTQQQWGGSFGGPIVKERSFYFAAFERQDITNPRQVLFSSLPAAAPTDGVEAFNIFKGLEGPYTQTNDATTYMVKVDHDFTSKHRISARFNFHDNNAENAVTAGTSLSPATPNALSSNGTEQDRSYTTAGQLTSSLSATMVNELRMQWSREIRPRTANEPLGPAVNSAAGNYGTTSFFPTTQKDYRVQISDGFTKIIGAHTVKFGGDFNYTFADQIFGFNQFGIFSFQTSTIATILEDMSLGGPTANRFDQDRNTVRFRRQIGNLFVDYNVKEFAVFAQDGWRIKNNLTLNFGFRWEGEWNPRPQADNTDLISRIGGLQFPVGLSFDPTAIPDSLKQFMPRVGLAWSPGAIRKTVIRVNGGIFYARTPMLVFAGPMNNFRKVPGDVSIELPLAGAAGVQLPCGSTVYQQLRSIGVDLNASRLDNLPLLTAAQVQSVGAACGLTVNPLRGAQLLGVGRDFTNPRSWQWSAGMESEVRRGLTLGADFNYVNTVHLQRTHDLNLNPPTIRAADGRPIYSSGRTLSDFSQIWIRESSARALYRSAVFRANFRRARYQFNGFYTLSWNYSDDDNERSATFTDAQDQFNRVGDYSFSRLDRRHQFAGFGTFGLPYGMELGTNLRFLSAPPFDARGGSDLNLDGDSATDRPFSAPGATFLRNAFRNRPFYVVNLRAAKQFKVTDKTKVQFSVDFFNLFDNDNVQFTGNNLIYGPGINTTTGAAAPIDARFMRLRNADGSYDTVNAAGDPFQMQIGLKLIF